MPFVIYSERNEQESAKQFAYRILRRNILLLDMVPGEPISEKEIAKKLELSLHRFGRLYLSCVVSD